MTHWVLAGDVGVEIVNFHDDHSRLCLASVALPVTKVLDVLAIFQSIGELWHPGPALNRQRRDLHRQESLPTTGLETELERLGVVAKHSSPYHPQTCEARTVPSDDEALPRQTTECAT
jgi:hypothetical protein